MKLEILKCVPAVVLLAILALSGCSGATGAGSHVQSLAIVGQSSFASDPGACNGFPDNNNLNCHAFLWDQGALLDLTTSSVGGSPEWIAVINDDGEIPQLVA